MYLKAELQREGRRETERNRETENHLLAHSQIVTVMDTEPVGMQNQELLLGLPKGSRGPGAQTFFHLLMLSQVPYEAVASEMEQPGPAWQPSG